VVHAHEQLIGIGIRATVVYLYTLLIMRLASKRDVKQLSPIDVAAAFILGDLFDDVIWAEVPLAQGIVAISTLMAAHGLTQLGICRSMTLCRLLGSEPRVLARDGRFLHHQLRRAHVSEAEVLSWLRLNRFERLEETREVRLETNGTISVLPVQSAEPAQKRDLPRVLELAR
jgi:uncharacterized membrane protein YcaP (DUF421 family)